VIPRTDRPRNEEDRVLFTLHPRLAADTALILDAPLCRVLLMDEVTYPWLILVPRRAGLAEIGDLSPADRGQLIDEIAIASAVLRRLETPQRINVAALGNIVEQLHVHVIARLATDPAWPGPVWGRAAPVRFDPAAREARLDALRRVWAAGNTD
jgi:diadenosine tetraphosphate (Ap4A) HIT family hydrolase